MLWESSEGEEHEMHIVWRLANHPRKELNDSQTYFPLEDTILRHYIVMLNFLFIVLTTYMWFMAWVHMKCCFHSWGSQRKLKIIVPNSICHCSPQLLLQIVKQNKAGFKYLSLVVFFFFKLDIYLSTVFRVWTIVILCWCHHVPEVSQAG